MLKTLRLWGGKAASPTEEKKQLEEKYEKNASITDCSITQQWKLVKNRKKKHYVNKPVIGYSTSLNTKLKTVSKRSYAHIYRLDPETTVSDLENFLVDHASFVVTVDFSDYDKVTDPTIWPSGDCVNLFFFSCQSLEEKERSNALSLSSLLLNVQSIRSKILECEVLMDTENISVVGFTEH